MVTVSCERVLTVTDWNIEYLFYLLIHQARLDIRYQNVQQSK